MDGEAETVSGCSHGENNRSYKAFLMDMEDLEETAGSDAEEHSTKRRHQEQTGSLKSMQHTGSSGTDRHELHGADSSGFLHEHPVCVSQDSWAVSEEEHIYENLLHPCFTAEGSISQSSPGPTLECLVYLNDQHNGADCLINRPASSSVSPVSVRPHHSTPTPRSLTAISTAVSSTASSMMTSFIPDTYSPVSFMCGINSSVTDPLMSASKSPCCSDHSPVSAAAHLHLLGESLALIGRYLQETDKMVCMSSSFSLLLDSLLCAMAPLTGLTVHVPELRSCTQHTLASTLENIAFVMPGL